MPEHRAPGDLRRGVEAVAALPSVAAVDVLAHDSRVGGPLAELVLRPYCERVPPAILRKLGVEDCGVRRVARQGDHIVVEVV